jgi:putative polymerase
MAFDNGTIRPRYWVDSSGRQIRASLPLPSREFLAAATVYIAVVFNLALAIVNANAFDLNKTLIIVAEMMIVGVAIAICARSLNRLMIPWLVVISALAILFIIISMFRQTLEAKYFRDVLLILIFIMLGTTYAKGNIVKLFVFLQSTILGVMIFEGLSPELFGMVANPQRYYINTREFPVEAFWNPNSSLFVSATRPPGMGQFFDWLTALGITTRLSSVFLEPVTLGNWCTVAVVFLATFWHNLTRKETIFFIVSTFIILLGSDGRFATVTILIIVAVTMIIRIVPRYVYALYLPGAVCAAIVVGIFFDTRITADDFLGRLAFSVHVISSMNIMDALGLDSRLLDESADSGITYFILSQSFLGVFIIWLAICFLQPQTNRTAIVYMNALCIYISLSLLISFSMFSIKTAAPLWFLYGYVRALSASSAQEEEPFLLPPRPGR